MSPAGWETVIGLEVHVQLKTRTKLFCGCVNKYGADPNTLVCPICLGMPGVLPVLNRQAYALAIRAGLALGCEVASLTKFDRKNYYYPDLPKGYQVSQYDRPLNGRGAIGIEAGGVKKDIGITRVHLEEDAGKLIHPETEGADYSFVDFNRSGVPLVEIVSEPDMRSPEEAYAYLTTLKTLLQYVDVSDCDMEKGSLRCDANVSIRRPGEEKLGTKTEVKNLDSFKAVAKALAYEAERHAAEIAAGRKVKQVTLNWDAAAEKTVVLRSKEEAHDYRYFPEPDLLPVTADPAFVARVRAALPEAPVARRDRYVRELGLTAYDAGVLTADRETAELFDKLRGEGLPAKVAANWVMKHVMAVMNERRFGASEYFGKARRIAEVAKKVEAKEITGQTGAEVFAWILTTPETASVDEHIQKQGLAQVSDTGALETIARDVIARNPKIVADYKGGKPAAIQALVGQMMRETKGKANAGVARELLARLLG